ncbi:hypothetical protein M1555_01850 [Patescibacteria group bacterium]|nr:hypothetical protein [Patescibacteria group bacterium]
MAEYFLDQQRITEDDLTGLEDFQYFFNLSGCVWGEDGFCRWKAMNVINGIQTRDGVPVVKAMGSGRCDQEMGSACYEGVAINASHYLEREK